MRNINHRGGLLGGQLGGLLFVLALAWGGAVAGTPKVVITNVKYELALDDKLPAVRDMLIGALEARNYAIINQLNVQEGLKARGIDAPALQLIEFCNLTKAYTITRHVPDFEMFAPCRIALIEEGGKTVVMVLRPAFVLSLLALNPKLTTEGKESLEQFDRDLRELLNEVASGGL
jgi:uncharacterized protein (DUF302 family)